MINKALLFLKITLNLVGAPGFEPEPRAPKARMPAVTPYPDMVGSAALESLIQGLRSRKPGCCAPRFWFARASAHQKLTLTMSQPFQGCATPSQLTPQSTHGPLFQKIMVDAERIERSSPGCRPGILPLNYAPIFQLGWPVGVEPTRDWFHRPATHTGSDHGHIWSCWSESNARLSLTRRWLCH